MATLDFKTNNPLTTASKVGNFALNFAKALPEEFSKQVGQPILKSFATVGAKIAGGLNASFVPTGEFQKKLFGTAEPISFSSKAAEFGIKNTKIAPFIGAAAVVGDILPYGGEKKAIETLATETSIPKIIGILKKSFPFLDEKVIETIAPAISKTKLPQEVNSIINTTKNVVNKIPTIEEATKNVINTSRLNITTEAKNLFGNLPQDVQKTLSEVRGGVLSNQEVVKAAQDASILAKATSKAATLKSEAALLKTRQNLSALAEGKTITKDFVDNLRIVSAEATRRGRELQALSIGANPELNTIKNQIIKHLVDLGKTTDEILDAAKGVDFTNMNELTTFFRKFVPPTFSEKINEFRYINLLSSPKTHIVNAFSNALQAGVMNPSTKLVTGGLDFIHSALTGKAREAYVREVPVYLKGLFNGMGEAVSSFAKAMSGKTAIMRPDIKSIPTGSKLLKPFEFIPKFLEASDVFFRTLISSGEKESLAYKALRSGTGESALSVATKAENTAQYFVFRKALDSANKTGQGKVLSTIDKLTENIYRLRDVPGVRWFIPFVQTPMNILKQGLEYSPVGLTTLAGASNKTEQLAKSLIGSAVFAGAASMAFTGNATWAAPTSEKEKELFYASGRQAYSLKIGNNWVSYSRLGPLAYPIAMAAALQWFTNENPKRVSQTQLEKTSKVLAGVAQFFSDQSYMQGLGDFVDAARGDTTAISRAVSNFPSQLIPLSALDRWVAQLIDPVYRKSTTSLSVNGIIQNLKSGLPWLSKSLPSYKTPLGTPSKRPNPYLNAINPLTTTPEKKTFENRLQGYRKNQQIQSTPVSGGALNFGF